MVICLVCVAKYVGALYTCSWTVWQGIELGSMAV